MVPDRPLEELISLPDEFLVVGEPNRGKAIGMADVRIEGRDDIDEFTEMPSRSEARPRLSPSAIRRMIPAALIIDPCPATCGD